MYDGGTSTVLLSENLQAVTWAGATLGDNCFGIGVEHTNLVPDSVGGGANGNALALQVNALQIVDLSGGMGPDMRINRTIAAPEGQRPRPSSLHPGGVVMTFVDGRAQFVNDSVDSRVYVHILSPGGSRYGQDVVTNGDIKGGG